MLNKEVLTNIFKKLLEEAKNSYDDFNSADGKIGDGDLGVTILHGLEEINNSISKFSDDMEANFILCSQAFVKRSGFISAFPSFIIIKFGGSNSAVSDLSALTQPQSNIIPAPIDKNDVF